ncbi:proline dehydrogenase family protein [Marinitenerispora sediminis]|uniref:proline dehydrogenase n=1 Tax=Marinitenerispora sediminis TaxID=1931232 RepID=A0A368TBU9_9ACTN|nr:proline dehydrogenase family protein [Marinitenerispora sediminis]RCV54416.1 proline dehydrogenase [Marinitenerispora sediminis]RCV61145.1 proline dehydrogenase [Marinitenerispora sediminis]RCV62420.1 proline dehydrogenase [Marinitenerispora sediminis]
MLRTPLLIAARSPRCRALVEHSPLTRGLVTRFVAGETLEEALPVVAELTRDRLVTLDHLGEDVTDTAQAEATVAAYTRLLAELDRAGLAGRAEVSVKLSAVGQALPADGEKIALHNARRICEAAARAGTTVTLDMEDHTTTDSTLGILRDLRVDFPWVGAVLQSYLHRTEADCRDLAGPGSRVRLCKGAYDEPASVAYRDRAEVDRSYVRCMRILMAGEGYPMIASHDPRMVAIAGGLAVRHGRSAAEYEHQMLFGIREAEQRRIAAAGGRMRVYVPFGTEWYGYFMRRLAERPANLAFFLRSLAGRR